MRNNYKVLTEHYTDNIMIVLKSLLVGLLAGGITVLYRIVLSYAEHFSFGMYDFLRGHLAFFAAGVYRTHNSSLFCRIFGFKK